MISILHPPSFTSSTLSRAISSPPQTPHHRSSHLALIVIPPPTTLVPLAHCPLPLSSFNQFVTQWSAVPTPPPRATLCLVSLFLASLIFILSPHLKPGEWIKAA